MTNPFRLPLFVARRYLFSKKRVAAINIISAISVAGVAFGTAAFLCTLSVFNGFHDLIGSLYTAFDPEIEVVPTQGKTAAADDPLLVRMKADPAVEAASACFEDHALILFRGRPTIITLKGVDDNYDKVTGIRSILYGEGQYRLHNAGVEYGIPGIGLASSMGSINFGQLQICTLRDGERINVVNPSENFNVADIYASGVCFDVNQRKYDENYMLTSIDFARNLFERQDLITSLELKLKPSVDATRAKSRLAQIGGERFKVLDRIEQQAELYSVQAIEKLMAYLLLTFILLLACFNVIGSVSMLILDKQNDIVTLRHLGATRRLVFRVFHLEGCFIAFLGAILGLVLGLFLCWLQQEFGLIRLGGSEGNFIVDAYPVSVYASDIFLVLATVLVVGSLSIWYPVHFLVRRFWKEE